jgi:uncharacterized protein
MTVTPTRIISGDLRLEATLHTPDHPSSSAVVVCHPHPLRGGDMHNNVVMAAAHSLQAAGITALTFNFRGVGASQGAPDDGNAEQHDVRAALQHAAALDGIEHIGVAGYSFGAGMALAVAATRDEPISLALVSLPTANPDVASRLKACKGPVLLMVGDGDHVSSSEALLHAAKSRPKNATEVVIVPGVDHFWRGAESTLDQHIGAFFTKHLK